MIIRTVEDACPYKFRVAFQIPPPQPCYASNLDANPQSPDVVRLLGFFLPIFHGAILIDADRQNRRVDGI